MSEAAAKIWQRSVAGGVRPPALKGPSPVLGRISSPANAPASVLNVRPRSPWVLQVRTRNVSSRGRRVRFPRFFIGCSHEVKWRGAASLGMSALRRFRSRPLLAVTVVACACAAVAAGAVVRSHDSGGPAATTPSWQENLRQIGHRYAECLRTHGHPQIADPTLRSNGRLSFGAQDDTVSAASRALRGDTCRAAARGAQGRPPKPPTTAELRQLVRFSRCVRTHGLPDWPDPATGHSRSMSASAGRQRVRSSLRWNRAGASIPAVGSSSAVRRGARRPDRRLDCGPCARMEPNGEDRPAAVAVVRVDGAALGLDQPPGDGQPEAGSARVAVAASERYAGSKMCGRSSAPIPGPRRRSH